MTNALFTSSAAVERLFSTARQILCYKLPNQHFDMFVFLKDYLKGVREL